MFAFTFFVGRVYFQGHCLIRIIRSYQIDNGLNDPLLKQVLGYSSFVLYAMLYLLNLYWFSLIMKGVMKVLGGKRGTSKPKV